MSNYVCVIMMNLIKGEILTIINIVMKYVQAKSTKMELIQVVSAPKKIHVSMLIMYMNICIIQLYLELMNVPMKMIANII